MSADETRKGARPQLTRGERLAERWSFLSPFVVKWCHERQWPTDWSGGECRLRRGHRLPHYNAAGRSWS